MFEISCNGWNLDNVYIYDRKINSIGNVTQIFAKKTLLSICKHHHFPAFICIVQCAYTKGTSHFLSINNINSSLFFFLAKNIQNRPTDRQAKTANLNILLYDIYEIHWNVSTNIPDAGTFINTTPTPDHLPPMLPVPDYPGVDFMDPMEFQANDEDAQEAGELYLEED